VINLFKMACLTYNAALAQQLIKDQKEDIKNYITNYEKNHPAFNYNDLMTMLNL
jgi:hypothetical protein